MILRHGLDLPRHGAIPHERKRLEFDDGFFARMHEADVLVLHHGFDLGETSHPPSIIYALRRFAIVRRIDRPMGAARSLRAGKAMAGRGPDALGIRQYFRAGFAPGKLCRQSPNNPLCTARYKVGFLSFPRDYAR